MIQRLNQGTQKEKEQILTVMLQAQRSDQTLQALLNQSAVSPAPIAQSGASIELVKVCYNRNIVYTHVKYYNYHVLH